MCIALPMTVVRGDVAAGLCDWRGQQRWVAMFLVGAQPAGTRFLVQNDSAVRVIDAAEAQLIENALDGVAAALQGRPFEHLFADLIDLLPTLPADRPEPRG